MSNVSVIEQVAAAMSRQSLEHRVIVSNIANRDTQGYQRLALGFERALQGAAPVVRQLPNGTKVPLEQDVVALSENAGRYQTLARVLNRYFAILNAITDQRG